MTCLDHQKFESLRRSSLIRYQMLVPMLGLESKVIVFRYPYMHQILYGLQHLLQNLSRRDAQPIHYLTRYCLVSPTLQELQRV